MCGYVVLDRRLAGLYLNPAKEILYIWGGGLKSGLIVGLLSTATILYKQTTRGYINL